MEKFFESFWPAIAVFVVGSIFVFVIKQTLKGFILDMQQFFVTIPNCKTHQDAEAAERQRDRIELEEVQARMREAGI